MYSSDPQPRVRYYLLLATLLLFIGAFFRLVNLNTAPPGLSEEELTNAQLANEIKEGHIAVIYDEVTPAREGLYYAYIALVTALTGTGTMLWRLPSIWVSMLFLATMTRLTYRLFGARVSLMALGLVAVSFWPVWLSRAVLHVTLMPLVVSLVALVFLEAFEAQRLARASLWFTVGGLLLGVSQYIHVTSWTLILLFFTFIIYRQVIKPKSIRPHWGNIIYSLMLTVVINLPLYIFLIRHPGVREPTPITQQPGLLAEIPGRLLSALAALILRGDLLPTHNLPGRPIMDPVLGILMIIGIGVTLARWRHGRYGFLLIWLAVGLLPSAFLQRRPDFEFMAVLLPIVFVFPAIGLRAIYQLIRNRLTRLPQLMGRAAIGLIVMALIMVNAVLTFNDFFIAWPRRADVREAHDADTGLLAHYLDTRAGSLPVSVCSIPVDTTADPFALTNKELLDYLMNSQPQSLRYFDCQNSLVLAEGGQDQLIVFPRSHYYEHLPGPLLNWMQYAEDAAIPGVSTDIAMRIDVEQELADRLGSFITTAPTAWPPESGTNRLATLPVNFAYDVAFLGYSVRDDRLHSSDWIELTTYWRLDGPSPPDLTLFAHMLGNPVIVIAQDDGLGVNTSSLHPRDIFIQYSMIQTPGGMAPGLYPLSVGLYVANTTDRLPAFEDDDLRGDRLFLQRVEVTP